MVICGIMTGTSLDGVDIALCKFGDNPSIEKDFELLIFEMMEIPHPIKMKLFEIIQDKVVSVKDLSQVNFAMAKVIAEAIVQTCFNNNFQLSDVDLIGLHGQTIWHNPTSEVFCGIETSSTLQIISGTALSALLHIPVVYDFRSADVALGGQGAPLVPIFDYHFLSSTNEDVIALNIGGMSNLTYLNMNCNEEDVVAFDLGPGNVLIDLTVQKYFGKKYDEGGASAREGNVIEEFFCSLCGNEFIRKAPPKSTGREYFNQNFIDNHLQGEHKPVDILRTLTEFTAYCISENIKLFANPQAKIIVSGGGEKNFLLMELLQKMLPESNIISSGSIGILSDAKEAIAFAFLAWRNAKSLPSNLCSVTGAKRAAILGSRTIVAK